MGYWIALIHNCFANCESFLYSFSPIKSIGDELMFFIEESDLLDSSFTPLQIYDALWQIATDKTSIFPEVKIGATYCKNVYPITFIKNNRDYYGLGIDLAARLKALAKPKQVIVDSMFYDKIMSDYNGIGNKNDFLSVRNMTGPEKQPIKGIAQDVTFYRCS
ncbi:MAG: adenylate/guanylate cyclase domain-containing protein [Deltaproteobacteria bacterium]|nr:adenylate/guanylate cyclase domain-containing protein [Deltaproteobacteria bacterium]